MILQTACTLLSTLPLGDEPDFPLWQQGIPDEYLWLKEEELSARIRRARRRLGKRLIVLAHHYQRDEIVRFADVTGDSLKLAHWAAAHPESEYVLFCGVHFMAESADILSRSGQTVILPNLSAGCSLADMAPLSEVLAAWSELEAAGLAGETIPVTYINSAAALKAFCGRNGGIVCTSSNARRVLEWAFARGRRVFFFPDQNLGRNTGRAMGIALDEMPLWNPDAPAGDVGGLGDAAGRARIILWDGFCSVHQRFSVRQIDEARRGYRDVRIAAHPECSMAVVEAADLVGSTERIIEGVTESPPGSVWGVATEVTLVNRLALANPDKTVFCLDPVVCPCSTMYRVHPAYAVWTLESLAEGRVVNRVSVDEDVRRDALKALRRMLDL